jgi:zinc D-Ala-D-Ala carboxypeptidase
MAELPRALGSIVNSLRGVDRSTSSFKQAANDNQRSMTKIVKDLTTMTSGQRKELSNLNNSMDDIAAANQQNAARISTTNSLLEESLTLQKSMITELRGLKALFSKQRESGETVSNVDPGVAAKLKNIAGSLFGVGKIAAGVVGGGLFANSFRESIKGGQADQNRINEMFGGSSQESERGATPVSDAKKSAEKYLGREISPNEWSELVRATSAEAGRKDKTEVAMVMATILNRARDKNKSIEEILREKNQFQAVTGTRFNPNPSPNFVNMPNDRRLQQIFSAATDVLPNVSRNQTNFTAADPRAYGPGTNPNYRNQFNPENRAGGSLFNTTPPVPQPSSSGSGTSDAERTSSLPSPTRSGSNGNLPDSALVSIGEGRHRLQPSAAAAYERMKKAAEADGIRWSVTDSYRTYDQQVKLAQEKGLYSQGGLAARPGTSNHGWGLAVDLGGGANRSGSEQNEWLRQNAARYGFRTIAREPWHWEYVGADAVKYGGDQATSRRQQNRRDMESPDMSGVGSRGAGSGAGIDQMFGALGANTGGPFGMGMGAQQVNPLSAILNSLSMTGGPVGQGAGIAGGLFGILQNILPPMINAFQQPEQQPARQQQAANQAQRSAIPTNAPMPPPRPPELTPTTDQQPEATQPAAAQETTQQVATNYTNPDPLRAGDDLLEFLTKKYNLGGEYPGVFV